MKTLFLKLIYNLNTASLLRNAKGNSISVLCLHRITEEKDFFFEPINPKIFENLVRYCLKYYEIISFKDIDKKTKKPKLIFSFDDGYYDFIEYAVPILNKFSLPSNHNLVNICLNNNETIWTQKLNDIFNYLKSNSLFNDELIAKYGKPFTSCRNNWMTYYIIFFQSLLKLKLNERNEILNNLVIKYNIHSKYRMMNWEDAKYCLEKNNVEIGCHTYSHDTLTSIDNNSGFDLEIGNSVKEMEFKLNNKIEILALPNGLYNTTVLDYCRKTDLKYILLTDDGINHLHQNINKLSLIKRIYLVNETFEETILRTELFHSKIKKLI